MQLGLGELSRYKGLEHYNDALPSIQRGALTEGLRARMKDNATTSTVPEAYDFTVQYKSCFALDGKEVIRQQGECGSCWAFTTASAAMANMCASAVRAGKTTPAFRSAEDRFEISVQQMMTCNAGQRGCNGGSVVDADSAFGLSGLAKEADAPYKCGTGSHQSHFEQTSGVCDSYPWNGNCASNVAQTTWHWGGVTKIIGEPDMTYILSLGHTLYMTLDAYTNFLYLNGSAIVTTLEGDLLGGHAVVGVGYGSTTVSDVNVKYWLLQNSWGTSWGVNGYGKVLRGNNFGGIEDGAYYVRAWADGSAEPPCWDSEDSGLGSADATTGETIWWTCTKAAGYCQDTTYGAGVRQKCPVTCKTCNNAGDDLPGGAPSPSEIPPVVPTPAAVAVSNSVTTSDGANCIEDGSEHFKGECYFRNKCKSALTIDCNAGCKHMLSGFKSTSDDYSRFSCSGVIQKTICAKNCTVICTESDCGGESPALDSSPSSPSSPEDSGSLSSAGSLCFHRETDAWAASSPLGPWRRTPMPELQAGDYVLSADASTGEPIADRVLKNFHVSDESTHPMLEIVHQLGKVIVTPDHVLYVNDQFQLARSVKQGDVLRGVRHSSTRAQLADVTVQHVKTVFGRIINPLTQSGLILVAGDATGSSIVSTTYVSPFWSIRWLCGWIFRMPLSLEQFASAVLPRMISS